jgi:uncharacterized protein YrrD
MLHRLDTLVGMPIEALDREIGTVKDACFDNHEWTIRHLVVEAGSWLGSRKVLISTASVMNIDWTHRRVQVGLIRSKVAVSPSIEATEPVSREHERDLHHYPYYWASLHSWDPGSHPFIPSAPLPPNASSAGKGGKASRDPHLRSAQQVHGYRLETTEDSMGHVEDLIFDGVTWAIRYLLVDTRNWFPGRHVVIPPRWITGVDWTQRVVNVDVSPGTVRSSPEFQSGGQKAAHVICGS